MTEDIIKVSSVASASSCSSSSSSLSLKHFFTYPFSFPFFSSQFCLSFQKKACLHSEFFRKLHVANILSSAEKRIIAVCRNPIIRRHQKLLIFMLTYFGYAVLYSTRKPFSVVKPYIQHELKIDTIQLGAIDSVFLAAYAICQIFLPHVAEAIGVKTTLLCCYVVSSLCSLFFALSNNHTIMIYSWLLNGASHALVFPLLVKLLIPFFSYNVRGQVLGLWTTSQQTGAMFSTAFASYVADALDWRAAFTIPAAVCTITGFVFFFFLFESDDISFLCVSTDNDVVEKEMNYFKKIDACSIGDKRVSLQLNARRKESFAAKIAAQDSIVLENDKKLHAGSSKFSHILLSRQISKSKTNRALECGKDGRNAAAASKNFCNNNEVLFSYFFNGKTLKSNGNVSDSSSSDIDVNKEAVAREEIIKNNLRMTKSDIEMNSITNIWRNNIAPVEACRKQCRLCSHNLLLDDDNKDKNNYFMNHNVGEEKTCDSCVYFPAYSNQRNLLKKQRSNANSSYANSSYANSSYANCSYNKHFEDDSIINDDRRSNSNNDNIYAYASSVCNNFVPCQIYNEETPCTNPLNKSNNVALNDSYAYIQVDCIKKISSDNDANSDYFSKNKDFVPLKKINQSDINDMQQNTQICNVDEKSLCLNHNYNNKNNNNCSYGYNNIVKDRKNCVKHMKNHVSENQSAYKKDNISEKKRSGLAYGNNAYHSKSLCNAKRNKSVSWKNKVKSKKDISYYAKRSNSNYLCHNSKRSNDALPENHKSCHCISKENTHASEKLLRCTYIEIIMIPNLMCSAMAYLFVKLVRYSLLFWLPYFLVKELSYEPSVAGYSSMMFDIGGIAGAIVTGFVSDRVLHGRRLTAAACMCLACGFALLLFTYVSCKYKHIVCTLLCMWLVGFCVSGPDSILGAVAAQDLCERSGYNITVVSIASGIINGFGGIGAVLQGYITAVVSEAYGWDVLFGVLCIFSVAAFILLLFGVAAEARNIRCIRHTPSNHTIKHSGNVSHISLPDEIHL